jgi:Leucine-rich repeat (LRR) protein
MLPSEPENCLMAADSFEQNRSFWQLPNLKELNLSFSPKLRLASAAAYLAGAVPAAL